MSVKINLNNDLLAFSRAIENHRDEMRLTDSKMYGISVDEGDVGVLKRTFRTSAGTRQIQENNAVRTALLRALRSQFGGEIPASVQKALNGSSLRGKSDMSTSSDDVNVNSGRPLTVRRVRAVLGQVLLELTQKQLVSKNPPEAGLLSQDEAKKGEKKYVNTLSGNQYQVKVEGGGVKEPLHLDEVTIFSFQEEMSDADILDVGNRMKADGSSVGEASKWFKAYTRWTIGRLTADDVRTGSADERTAFMREMKDSDYLFNQVHKKIDDLISHGKKHKDVQDEVKKFIGQMFKDVQGVRKEMQGKAFGVAVKATGWAEPNGLASTDKLPPGTVLSQGTNTCPIISLTNAMLMTGGEMAEKAKSFLVRHKEGEREYFEFPYLDEKGNNIRAYTDEFEKEYIGNTARLSDFEKAVFVALKKAELQIIKPGKDESEFKPGQEFEIGSVFVLFGFNDPATIGNEPGVRPTKVQQRLDGAKIAEALRDGKPCVIRLPNHFVGIESVKFDNDGLPTYGYFDSSARKSFKIGPNDNTGIQFYIGEKA